MLNNKGSVTILAIYICTIILMLSLLTKSIFMENYYYYKQIDQKYNLFLIENAIIKNIYGDSKNIKYKGDNISYKGEIIRDSDNRDIKYKIKLIAFKDVYEYEVVYDQECYQILEFINTDMTLQN